MHPSAAPATLRAYCIGKLDYLTLHTVSSPARDSDGRQPAASHLCWTFTICKFAIESVPLDLGLALHRLTRHLLLAWPGRRLLPLIALLPPPSRSGYQSSTSHPLPHPRLTYPRQYNLFGGLPDRYNILPPRLPTIPLPTFTLIPTPIPTTRGPTGTRPRLFFAFRLQQAYQGTLAPTSDIKQGRRTPFSAYETASNGFINLPPPTSIQPIIWLSASPVPCLTLPPCDIQLPMYTTSTPS